MVFFHQSKSQRPSFVPGGGGSFFTKVSPSHLVLSGGGVGVTWSGKVHAMIKFKRSWTYEKGDMRLTLKTDSIIIKGQIFVDL